jgi:hypothetical protein
VAQRGRKNADDVLLQALACGATIDHAARQAGISQATVYRRLKEPAFQHRLRELRAAMVQRTTAMLTASGGEAVKALLAQVQQESTPPATRRAAARDILELGMKLRESTELEQRLADLEARVGESERPS